ncbi:MAG: tetratricopeptide repeat protein [candidate division WOR-3 bacterium]
MVSRYDAPLRETEWEKKRKEYLHHFLQALKKEKIIPENGRTLLNFDLLINLVNFRLPEEEMGEEDSFEEWDWREIMRIYQRFLRNSEFFEGEEVLIDERFLEIFFDSWDEVVFEDFLTSQIADDAQDATSLLNRGNAYWEKKMYWQALGDYAQALRMEPDEPLIYFNRAHLFIEIGEYEKAIEDLARAMEKEDSSIGLELIYSLRAEAFFQLNRLAEGLSDLKKVLALCRKRLKKLPFSLVMVDGKMINHRLIIEEAIIHSIKEVKAIEKKGLGEGERKTIEKIKRQIIFLRNEIGL